MADKINPPFFTTRTTVKKRDYDWVKIKPNRGDMIEEADEDGALLQGA